VSGGGIRQPVNAGRLVDAAVRQLIDRRRPGDAVTGEELGADLAGRRRLYSGPIDGTRAYAAARPDWRTLIALEADGDWPVPRSVDTPILGS
jgi:histidinol-phosphatase